MWLVRGLEHDLGAEARTIGEAIRSAMQFVQAHTAFDLAARSPAALGVSAGGAEVLERVRDRHAGAAAAARDHAERGLADRGGVRNAVPGGCAAPAARVRVPAERPVCVTAQ